MKQTRKHWKVQEEKEVVRLYNLGLSYAEIAEELGRTESSCSVKIAALRKEGLYNIDPPRSTTAKAEPITADEIDEYKSLNDQGYNTAEIAEIMSISENRVGSIRRNIKNHEEPKAEEPELPFTPERKTGDFYDFLTAFFKFLGEYLN